MNAINPSIEVAEVKAVERSLKGVSSVLVSFPLFSSLCVLLPCYLPQQQLQSFGDQLVVISSSISPLSVSLVFIILIIFIIFPIELARF